MAKVLFIDLTESEVKTEIEKIIGENGYTIEPDGYGYVAAIGDNWLPDNYQSEDIIVRIILAELIGEERTYFNSEEPDDEDED